MVYEGLLEKNIKKLKGFCRYPRQYFALFSLGILNESEYMLYHLIVFILTDWDSRHPMYKTFVYDYEQIKWFTEWSSSKTTRLLQQLTTKGLIKLEDSKNKVYSVSFFGIKTDMTKGTSHPFGLIANLSHISDPESKKMNENERFIENSILNLDEPSSNMTAMERKFTSKFRLDIVSYRDSLVLDSIEREKLYEKKETGLSDAEYERISLEMGL